MKLLSAVLISLLASRLVPSTPPPPFSVAFPRGMVTGPVLLEARTTDENVAFVRWEFGDWSKTTPRPFLLSLDLGPVPHQRHIRVAALDRMRNLLHEKNVLLNRGGRGLHLMFVDPASRKSVSGEIRVVVRVESPADDEIEKVVLLDGEREQPFEKEQDLFRTLLTVPPSTLPPVARVRTRRGRESERTLLLNARGLQASSDVCVVQQAVGVYRSGRAVEDLRMGDFSVRDDRGECPVRAVEYVRNLPVAVGFAIDGSTSLAGSRPFLKEAASRFIDQCFGGDDVGFVVSFGPTVTNTLGWTNDRTALKDSFGNLPEWGVAGAQLYEAVVSSLYQFQGAQGARALVLLTDGYDYDGDTSEAAALAYARESGVKIHALAVASRYPSPVKPKAGRETESAPSFCARSTSSRSSATRGTRTRSIPSP